MAKSSIDFSNKKKEKRKKEKEQEQEEDFVQELSSQMFETS